MTEDNKKPKATLIKQVVSPTETREEPKVEAKQQKKPATERRRVVVVKKKVVVAKPKAEPQKSAAVPAEPTVKTEGEKPASPRGQRTVSPRLKSSPLHSGPVVIRPTNLPPVPNQGLTVKAHAELQNLSPQNAMPVPSNGPRVAGMVGGRPAPGTRPPYQERRPYQGGSGGQGQQRTGG